MSVPLLVEHALEAVKYRVYPDTPVSEVVDLMVRRGARAIPVVGEQYEVLGIITTSDALQEVLRDGAGEESSGESRSGTRRARDVMTRAVLCVSETQPLVDAARMMANKKIEQLPVVRDGELIGLITRDAILHAIHGETADHKDKGNDA